MSCCVAPSLTKTLTEADEGAARRCCCNPMPMHDRSPGDVATSEGALYRSTARPWRPPAPTHDYQRTRAPASLFVRWTPYVRYA